jgi:hypothetical protein
MKNNSTNKTADKLFTAIGKLCGIYFDISYYGLKKFEFKSLKLWFNFLFFLMVTFSLTYNYDFLVISNKILPFAFTQGVIAFLVKMPWLFYFASFSLMGIFFSFPLYGLREYKKIKAYQKDFDFLSMSCRS